MCHTLFEGSGWLILSLKTSLQVAGQVPMLWLAFNKGVNHCLLQPNSGFIGKHVES